MAVAHRIYAAALFEAAKEKGRLDAVRTELADFLAALAEVPALHAVLVSPELDAEAKTAILGELFADSDELLTNFLRLLVDKGRIAEIEEIGEEFERLAAAEEGVLRVDLTTAIELSDDEAQTIIRQIEQASGRRIEATRGVDPRLVGGIVLRVGSLRVDASVRGRLERLRQELVTRS